MRFTHYASSARLEYTIRKQITSILALVENAVIRLFGDAGRVKALIQHTKVVLVFLIVVSRSLGKGFRSTVFYSAVEEAVNKYVPRPPSVEAVDAKLVYVTSSQYR